MGLLGKWSLIKKYERKGSWIQMIRLLSLFSGIGAVEKALKVPYELVGFSEIDKFAIKSYCAIHNEEETKNLGDIKLIKTDNLKQIDFMTWRISLSRY